MEHWLTIVLIGAGIIVYTSIFNRNDHNSKNNKLLASMEQSFEHFAMELEEDNNRLLEHVLVLKEQFDEKNAALAEKIQALEKQLEQHQTQLEGQKDAAPQAAQQAAQQASIIYKPPAVRQPEKSQSNKLDIRQRYEQLFALHDAGKSIDYIAKACEINKGEVQLILQLGKQEERESV